MIEIQNAYTVAQVNTYIKNMFKDDRRLQTILVKGEVSNCTYNAATGHIFFTLKDNSGSIACVMFAGYARSLKFRLQEGQQVVIAGYIDVYEKSGTYQLMAKQIILDGIGALYETFAQLKEELEELGMFDCSYKQQIPPYNFKVGVITAPTGAAVRDIINIATRRNPFVQIILYPALVQGQGAVASVVQGIKVMDEKKVDVIIVGRGGGSIEDLWAFNEREVAQAIFDCKTPIISAVGHETDTTIADYVADLRAPTPSAAAELAVFEYSNLQQNFVSYEMMLQQKMKKQIEGKRYLIERWQERFQYNSPGYQIRDQRMRLITFAEKFTTAMERNLTTKKHKFSVYCERLQGLSPLQTLSQGYSYITDCKGKVIKQSSQVEIGDTLRIQLAKGNIEASVMGKDEK